MWNFLQKMKVALFVTGFCWIFLHRYQAIRDKNYLRKFTHERFSKFSLFDQSTPFCDAIISTKGNLKERFFFPGHGGQYAPNLIKDMGSSLFDNDLPELDGLDNIHFPEVFNLRCKNCVYKQISQ